MRYNTRVAVVLRAELGGIRIATSGRLYLTSWDDTPTAEAVRKVGEEQLKYFDEVGHKVVVANFMNPRAGATISSEVRGLARDVADETAHTTLGLINVIEGGGFFAATVRMVMNGIFLLRPPPYPYTNVLSVEEAADWSANQAEGAMPMADIERALREFRKHAE